MIANDDDVLRHELVDLARSTALRAGELLLERFRAPVRGLARKSTPTDWVSDADRDSEQLITEALARRRPGDGVLGEEGAVARSESGLRWVIDPLDGTVNFLFGIPTWCVSIACEDENGPVVGVIHDPNREETWVALRSGGATLNDEPVAVSQRNDLSQALIATGFYYDAGVRARQAEMLLRVLPNVRDVRRAGSAALDLAYTACGRVDAFYESQMERWDRAAGELIVREAGGIVTDLDTSARATNGMVAAGPALHDRLDALVAGRPG